MIVLVQALFLSVGKMMVSSLLINANLLVRCLPNVKSSIYRVKRARRKRVCSVLSALLKGM